MVSGLALAAIPRAAEAATIWDSPNYIATKETCISHFKPPAHAQGLNVLYADSHARFVPFGIHTLGASWSPCVWDFLDERAWEGYFD